MARHVYRSPLIVERVHPVSIVLGADGEVVSHTHVWLDMQVTLGRSLRIQLHSRNEDALVSGGCLQHFSLPIFETWDGATKERVRWWLGARVRRIAHVNNSVDSVHMVCKEMELFGYPVRRINRMASALRQFAFVRAALQIRTSK